MKNEKNQEKKYITVEEYSEMTEKITGNIINSTEDAESIISQINNELNTLDALKAQKDLVNEKIDNIKKSLRALSRYRFFKILEVRNLRKKLNNLNDDLKEYIDSEEQITIDVRDYGLNDDEQSNEQVLTTELYKRLANNLTSKISQLKKIIDDTESKITEKTNKLEKLNAEKKANKQNTKKSKDRLCDLRDSKLSSFTKLKGEAKEFNKLNSSITKSKKR